MAAARGASARQAHEADDLLGDVGGGVEVHVVADGPLADAWASGARLSMGDAVDLARRGRGERRRPAAGWESLTATEAKVAALVAEGRTNPEIAEALIMGWATVKTHVSSILRKLDLTNRAQVAAASARR